MTLGTQWSSLANPLNLYLASEIKLNIPCTHVTMVPLLCPPQCAREQGQHHQGDPLHPQGECEEEHEERGHAGEELQGAPGPPAQHPALLRQAR